MIVTVANSFKGGTCKSSTCLHLGAALARFHGKRVLLVDFDPQANLSTGLGIGTDNLNTMVPVLQGEKTVQEVIQATGIEGLDIIPANTFLDQVEATAPLVTDSYAHERLRKALRLLDYDHVLIDTPPSLGWLTQSAFYAANQSLICTTTEPYSILALHRLAKYHSVITENHSIEVVGVLLSFWDKRGATNKAFLQAIDASFPGKLFESKVRRDINVSRAILQGKPVFDIASSAKVCDDYRSLAVEFLERSKEQARV